MPKYLAHGSGDRSYKVNLETTPCVEEESQRSDLEEQEASFIFIFKIIDGK